MNFFTLSIITDFDIDDCISLKASSRNCLSKIVFLAPEPNISRIFGINSLIFSAVFFTADLWFWHRSILYVGPGLATLLANFQVFFMLLASIMLFKQQPTKMQIIAIPVALLGLLAIVGIDWNQLHSDYRLGVIFGLLTAVSYTGYMLFMRQAQIDSKHVLPVR